MEMETPSEFLSSLGGRSMVMAVRGWIRDTFPSCFAQMQLMLVIVQRELPVNPLIQRPRRQEHCHKKSQHDPAAPIAEPSSKASSTKKYYEKCRYINHFSPSRSSQTGCSSYYYNITIFVLSQSRRYCASLLRRTVQAAPFAA